MLSVNDDITRLRLFKNAYNGQYSFVGVMKLVASVLAKERRVAVIVHSHKAPQSAYILVFLSICY